MPVRDLSPFRGRVLAHGGHGQAILEPEAAKLQRGKEESHGTIIPGGPCRMRAWLWKPFQEEPYGGDTVKKRFWAAVFLLATGLAQPLKVAILWHQHQPPYENPLTGQYEGPWVRMHGVNGYPWMAEVLLEFPEVKVSFDYTSTLLKQIQDYLSGKAKDAYWRVSKSRRAPSPRRSGPSWWSASLTSTPASWRKAPATRSSRPKEPRRGLHRPGPHRPTGPLEPPLDQPGLHRQGPPPQGPPREGPRVFPRGPELRPEEAPGAHGHHPAPAPNALGAGPD